MPKPTKKEKNASEQLIVAYGNDGIDAGCPADQMLNFIKAGVILQPKQLKFCAYAREADKPDGPKDIMLGGGRGAAKALSLNTAILTINKGWTTMGQIEVGDRLFDENGNPCFVLEKSEVFYNHDCYEVEFDNGERIVADAGHRWHTVSKSEQKAIDRRNEDFRAKRRNGRTTNHAPNLVGKNVLPDPPNGSVKTTRDIYESVRIKNDREINHRIRISKPLNIGTAELPIHPYLLGLWLGDGSRNAGRITSNDPEIFDILASLEIDSYKMKQKYEWRIVGFTSRLRDMGLYENKHIPEKFFWGDFEQRLQLLRGLMDSDGTCDKKGSVSFSNTDYKIIDGTMRIILSLGAKATITTGIPKLYGKPCSRYWKIHFCPTFNPFNLKRKSDRFKAGIRPTNFNHYIISVKKVKSVPTRCIAVSSPSHLFLCGKSLIPTHNTHGILAQLFCDDCQRIPGLKVLVVRKVGRANKEQIHDFRKKLLGNLKHNYREQASTITFENESLVIMGNFKDEKDLDKYLGLEYDLIHIVESNQLTLTKKMNILSCLRTNKTNWRPRCYEDTNPGGLGHFHNKQIFIEPYRKGKETETRYIHCTVDDNKFVDKGYKEYLEKLSGWQRSAWLDGSWDTMAGTFFTNFRRDVHVYPNERHNFSPKMARRWFGAYDYGFAHNTAFLLLGTDGAGNTFVQDEYMETGRTIEDNAEGIRYLLRKYGLSPSDLDFIAAGRDCFNRNEEGKTIAITYQEHGINLVPAEVDRINGWARCLDGFGDITRGIPSRIFINRQCENLIQQIEIAPHSETRVGDIEKFNANEDGEGGDDMLDCFRFAIASDPSHAIKFAIPVGITKMGIKRLASF